MTVGAQQKSGAVARAQRFENGLARLPVGALEVVLRSGLVVRVGDSFDAVTLRRLIATLENRAA